MKRIDSCPSIVETVSFFDDDERDFGSDIRRTGSATDLQTVPEHNCDMGADVPGANEDGNSDPGAGAAGGAAGKKQARSGKALTPDERKQRRLESNRLAAKRAYYRRLDKVNAMQQENKVLMNTVKENKNRIVF